LVKHFLGHAAGRSEEEALVQRRGFILTLHVRLEVPVSPRREGRAAT
jgi:hypothetical protein